MRTTITIDDHLARQLKDEMQRQGTSFRQTLETVLARGLAEKSPSRGQKPFRVRARPMGLKTGIDPARLHDLETDLEVDRFLSVTLQRLKES